MDFTFTARRPGPPLRPFVDTVWSAEGRIDYTRERILPTGAVTMIVNLGDPLGATNYRAEDRLELYERGLVCGPQRGFLVNQPAGWERMVGVTFRVGGAAAFFGVDADDLTDLVLDFQAVWGAGAAALRDRLGAADRVGERLSVMEQELCARWRPPAGGWPTVAYAVERLSRPAPPAIGALATDIGISAKHLIAQFRRHVGLTPKAYARIARLNRLLAAIDTRAPIQWDRLAHANDYYDQSHFNRDFRAFAGVSPSRYVALRAEIYGDAIEPGESVTFVPVA